MSELPQGWVNATLADLGEWSSGGTPSRRVPAYYGGTIPWVKTGDLDHAVVGSVEEFLTTDGLKNSAAKVFPKGSLLVAMYGATIGQTGLLGLDAATNQACAALLANGNTTELMPFVWRYMVSIQGDLRAAGQGGAQPNISQAILKSYPINVAPLPEQRRIVTKIDSLTGKSRRARDHLDHIPRLVEKYKQAVLAAAFKGDLTREWRSQNIVEQVDRHGLEQRRQTAWTKHSGLARYREAGGIDWQPNIDLPTSWLWASVDQLACIVQYGTSAKTDDDENGLPVLRMGNLQAGEIDTSSLKYLPRDHEEFPDLLLRSGDLLFNRTNSAELVGKSAVYEGQPTSASFASYLIRVTTSGMRSRLLSAYINSAFGRDWVASVVNQQVGQANVNGTKLRQLGVPVMPDAEQEQVAKRIQLAFRWIDRLASEASSARTLVDRLDQAVLAKAFRGELVPQDPTDEPASVLLEQIKAARETAPKAKRKQKATTA